MTREELQEKYIGIDGEQAIAYLQGWCKAYFAAGVTPEVASTYINNAVTEGDRLLEAAIQYRKYRIETGFRE